MTIKSTTQQLLIGVLMLSFIIALFVAVSSLFSSAPMPEAPIVESAPTVHVDWNDPYSIIEAEVEDLSYGEFEDVVELCFTIDVENESVGIECVERAAYVWPHHGWSFYSDLSARRGYVTNVENEFFTYYDMNERP